MYTYVHGGDVYTASGKKNLADYSANINPLGLPQSVKKAIIKEPISLETPVTDDLCVGDYIEDKSYNAPDVQAKNNAMKGSINHLLSTLNEREQKIINCRFGINGETQMTLEQLGKAMGYSKERIRQLEDIALTKMRQRKELRHFRDFIED
mgnify:CR=1 FL=1